MQANHDFQSSIKSFPLCNEIIEKFPELFTESIGPTSLRVRGVVSPEVDANEAMTFVHNPKALEVALKQSTPVIVVPPKLKEGATKSEGARNKTILVSPQVELALARTVTAYFQKTPYRNSSVNGIHPSAVVSPTAVVAKDAQIGPNAFIGAGTSVGSGAYIGACSVIEDGCSIGENTVIHPQVFVGFNTEIGKDCEIHPQSVIAKEGFGYAHTHQGQHVRIPHQGRVVIEDGVHIGGCCTIDRATFGETRIERGCIFDNHVHIAHNCRIGRNGVITAGFTMGGSSRIGANFVTGGKSVVTGHIEICDNVQLAALSGVTKGVSEPGQYGGNPLQPVQEFIKNKAALTHIADIQKQVKKIMKKLGIEA